MKNPGFKIVLASASPRRRQLFSYFGVEFITVSPKHSEELNEARSHLSVQRLVLFNAEQKVLSVKQDWPGCLIIGSDTVVFCKNRLFPKPKDKEEAKEFLYVLSRNPHWVYTGVFMWKEGKTVFGYERTKIYMEPLSLKEIEYYFAKEEPLDKAGGFGIQGFAGTFIRRIEGCFYNVMGLPLALVRRMFKEIGITLVAQ